MSDIEIARSVKGLPIQAIANKLNIPDENLLPYGHNKAKISLEFTEALKRRPQTEQTQGKLILVTAMSPTPAGEGKTTTSVGLSDALNRIGKKTTVCLREPSLGPCFGMKGGAAGGGHAQVIPMEDINLHFTGDFHAIGAAHNLLSAMIDNHIYWRNENSIDSRRVTWGRVVDMNDRALRQITSSLGGISNGFPRESGFEITVASEVMAIFCLAESLEELTQRLGSIIIGYTRERSPVYARDIKAQGAMATLLKDAFMPNLVQTLEGNPAIIHGGPFANIAHGCNSVVATRAALALSEYVITEAGFGADLGAEKFLNIKCRKSGLRPDASVIVATVRALKYHGRIAREHLQQENVAALQDGLANLRRHIRNLSQFGLPVVVAINRFLSDTDAEVGAIQDYCEDMGVRAEVCTHWSDGGAGAHALAQEVIRLAESNSAHFIPTYANDATPWEKAQTVARRIYGADDIIADKKIRAQFRALVDDGYGELPVCMAKTQYSFSTDPALLGAPNHFVVPIREVQLSSGAGFIVVICGDIMTMPGLPRVPAANTIHLDNNGLIQGLF